MASFLSIQEAELPVSVGTLRVTLSRLVSEIDASIRGDKEYRRWLSYYQSEFATPTRRPRGLFDWLRRRSLFAKNIAFDLSPTDWLQIIQSYEADYQHLSLWGKFVANVTGDRRYAKQLASQSSSPEYHSGRICAIG